MSGDADNDEDQNPLGEPLTAAQGIGLLLKMYSEVDPVFADKADEMYQRLQARGLSWDETMMAMKSMADERHEEARKDSTSCTPEEFLKLLDDF